VLRGTPNDDVIIGTPGDDIICGFGGNDKIDGLGGNDKISGDAGNDEIRGGPGDDTLFGGSGDDWIILGQGADVFEGGEGADEIESIDASTGDLGSGADLFRGGPGNDTVQGGSGDDLLLGGDGNDSLDGGLGNDHIVGDDGIDSGIGSDGSDLCETETQFQCEIDPVVPATVPVDLNAVAVGALILPSTAASREVPLFSHDLSVTLETTSSVNTQISLNVSSQDRLDQADGTGVLFASDIYDISVDVPFVSARLTIPFADGIVPNESSLVLGWFDESLQLWRPAGTNVVVDTLANTLTATLTHFSTYAVMDLNLSEFRTAVSNVDTCGKPVELHVLLDTSGSHKDLELEGRRLADSVSKAKNISEFQLFTANGALRTLAPILTGDVSAKAASQIGDEAVDFGSTDLNERLSSEIPTLTAKIGSSPGPSRLLIVTDSEGFADILGSPAALAALGRTPDVVTFAVTGSASASGVSVLDNIAAYRFTKSTSPGEIVRLALGQENDTDKDGWKDCEEVGGIVTPYKFFGRNLPKINAASARSAVTTINPSLKDTDGDEVPDGQEIERITFSNEQKQSLTTDGYGFLFERSLPFGKLLSDPTSVDGDGDGIPDGVELQKEYLVTSEVNGIPIKQPKTLNSFSYGFGTSNYKTNPLLADTDGDGVRDKAELLVGSNPTKKESVLLTGYSKVVLLRPDKWQKVLPYVSLQAWLNGVKPEDLEIANYNGDYDCTDVIGTFCAVLQSRIETDSQLQTGQFFSHRSTVQKTKRAFVKKLAETQDVFDKYSDRNSRNFTDSTTRLMGAIVIGSSAGEPGRAVIEKIVEVNAKTNFKIGVKEYSYKLPDETIRQTSGVPKETTARINSETKRANLEAGVSLVGIVILEKVFESILRHLRPGAKKPDRDTVDKEIKRRCSSDEVVTQLAETGMTCDSLPMLIEGAASWLTGTPDIREITVNRKKYIDKHPITALLNYRRGADTVAVLGGQRRWYSGIDPCTSIIDGVVENCDEYPYFASYQARGTLYAGLGLGIGPDLQVVKARPNQDEGRMYGNFVVRCQLNKRFLELPDKGTFAPPDSSTMFLVIPLPDIQGSGRFCRNEVVSDYAPNLDDIDP
jgi:RTX calcium-binding nonapeptide repeat (4 copies)